MSVSVLEKTPVFEPGMPDGMADAPQIGLEDLPVTPTVIEPLGGTVAGRMLELSTQQFAGDEPLPRPVPTTPERRYPPGRTPPPLPPDPETDGKISLPFAA